MPRAEPQEDFMRNNAAPSTAATATQTRVCPKQNCGVPLQGGGRQVQGKGCAWMAWRLVGQAQPPDVGHHVMLRPERGANVFFTSLYKLGKGKLHNVVKLMANCLEQKGTVGHESGRLRRPCCSKRTSSAKVLSATGFEELRQYDNVRVPEPSHQARHDPSRRQGLTPASARRTLRTSSCTCRPGPSCSSASNEGP